MWFKDTGTSGEMGLQGRWYKREGWQGRRKGGSDKGLRLRELRLQGSEDAGADKAVQQVVAHAGTGVGSRGC